MNAKDRALELYYRYYCKSVENATLFHDSFINEALSHIDEMIQFFDVFGDKIEVEYYNEVKRELLKLNIL
jgi:hypothetical protein